MSQLAERTKQEATCDELFEEAEYFFGDTLTGRRRGKRAMYELLYRFGYLSDDFWSCLETQEITDANISFERVTVTLQQEADDRGYDVDFGMQMEPFDDKPEATQ